MLRLSLVIVIVLGMTQAERMQERTSLPDSEATASIRRQASGGRFRQQPFRPQFFRDESSFNPNFLRDASSNFRQNFPMKNPMMMGESFDERQFSFPMRQNLRSPMMGFIPGDGLRSASISGIGNLGMKDSNLFAMPSSQFLPFRMPQNGIGNSFNFPVRSFPTTFFNMPFQAVAVTPFKVAADDDDDSKDVKLSGQSGTKSQPLKSALSDLPITSSSAFNPLFSGFPMQNAMMMNPGMNMAAFNGGDGFRSASASSTKIPTKLKLVPEGALRNAPSPDGPTFNPNMPMRGPQGFRPSRPEFEGLRSAGMGSGNFRHEEFEGMHSQERPFRRPEFPVRSAFPGPSFEGEGFRNNEHHFPQHENFPMNFAPNSFPSQSLKTAPPTREEALKQEGHLEGFSSAPTKSGDSSLKSAQSFSSSNSMKFRPVGMAPVQFVSGNSMPQQNLKAAFPSSGFDASSMSFGGSSDGFNMMPFMNNMAMPFRPIMLRPVKLVPSSQLVGVTKSASSSASTAHDAKSSDKEANDMDLEPMETKNHESMVRTSDLEDLESTQFESHEQQLERPKVTKSSSHTYHQSRRPMSHSDQYVNKEEYPNSHRSYSSFYAASYPHGYKGSATSHSTTKNQHRGQNHYYIPQVQHDDRSEQYKKEATPQASYSSTSHRQQPHPHHTSSSYVEIKMKPSHQQHKSASSKSEYEGEYTSGEDSQYKSHYDNDDSHSQYKSRYSDDPISQQKSNSNGNAAPQYKSRYDTKNAPRYESRMDTNSGVLTPYDYNYYKSPDSSELSYTDTYPQATSQTINDRLTDDTVETETLEATS